MPNVFFAEGCSTAGLLKRGNIDIYHRAVAHLAGGRIATVESFSIPLAETPWRNLVRKPGAQVLLAAVDNGKVIGQKAAIRKFFRDGQHLGIFTSPSTANRYAICLHKQQERFYRGK